MRRAADALPCPRVGERGGAPVPEGLLLPGRERLALPLGVEVRHRQVHRPRPPPFPVPAVPIRAAGGAGGAQRAVHERDDGAVGEGRDAGGAGEEVSLQPPRLSKSQAPEDLPV